MNRLAELLKKKSVTKGVETEEREIGDAAEQRDADGRQKPEELETLLRECENDEIAPEGLVDASLDDPVLLSLAQHWTFRISRLELFCSNDGCQSRRTVKTWVQLATQMQVIHGATKEETSDI
jgi:hypothetical protein